MSSTNNIAVQSDLAAAFVADLKALDAEEAKINELKKTDNLERQSSTTVEDILDKTNQNYNEMLKKRAEIRKLVEDEQKDQINNYLSGNTVDQQAKARRRSVGLLLETGSEEFQTKWIANNNPTNASPSNANNNNTNTNNTNTNNTSSSPSNHLKLPLQLSEEDKQRFSAERALINERLAQESAKSIELSERRAAIDANKKLMANHENKPAANNSTNPSPTNKQSSVNQAIAALSIEETKLEEERAKTAKLIEQQIEQERQRQIEEHKAGLDTNKIREIRRVSVAVQLETQSEEYQTKKLMHKLGDIMVDPDEVENWKLQAQQRERTTQAIVAEREEQERRKAELREQQEAEAAERVANQKKADQLEEQEHRDRIADELSGRDAARRKISNVLAVSVGDEMRRRGSSLSNSNSRNTSRRNSKDNINATANNATTTNNSSPNK